MSPPRFGGTYVLSSALLYSEPQNSHTRVLRPRVKRRYGSRDRPYEQDFAGARPKLSNLMTLAEPRIRQSVYIDQCLFNKFNYIVDAISDY